MMPPSQKIVEATLPYTLRPKGYDREKVIIAVLEFVIEEHSYTHCDSGFDVVNVWRLTDLIDELKSTVTLEEFNEER